MASASAGRGSSKSATRFGGLRTGTQTHRNVIGSRYATKSEVANHKSANDKMAKSFKNSLAQLNRRKS